jgi:NTE family protein
MDLVLEGGGVKGIALVGALSVFEEHGFEVNRVAGTSAGAIVGSLAAAGMSVSRMTEVMQTLDFRKFMDRSGAKVPVVSPGVSLVLDKGAFAGSYALGWLREMLAEQDVLTFGDLRLPPEQAVDLPAAERYRLVVMAADVTQRRLARLPWDYRRHYGLDPDSVEVAEAVRASMSIPFFFEPVRVSYQRAQPEIPVEATESILVDGGLLSNFPVESFDRPDGAPPRWPTIGIKLSSPAGSRDMFPSVAPGPLGLAFDLLSTMVDSRDNQIAHRPDVQARTVFVDTAGVAITNFNLKQADKDRLYDNGRRAAEEFLTSWDFWAYVQDYRTGGIRALRDVPSSDLP